MEAKLKNLEDSLSSLPNMLTISRILLVPVVILAFYMDAPWGSWIAFAAFSCACITDFFDGYVARLWAQTSRLGQFLDPIADKLLVATTLFLLVGFERISQPSFLPAIVILCREILVSGLREFLSEVQVSLPVSILAKWKTIIQMLAIGVLLIGDIPDISLPITMFGEIFLWFAAVLTLITGYDYLRTGLRHI